MLQQVRIFLVLLALAFSLSVVSLGCGGDAQDCNAICNEVSPPKFGYCCITMEWEFRRTEQSQSHCWKKVANLTTLRVATILESCTTLGEGGLLRTLHKPRFFGRRVVPLSLPWLV